MTTSPSESTTADLFRDLAGVMLHHYSRGRVVVAVDGADPLATCSFADALAEAARAAGRTVIRQGMDDLLSAIGEVDRPAGDDTESLYEPRVDYARVRAELLNGFRRGDFNPDGSVDQSDAILIVDGRFLLRPALRDSWNYRIWLDGEGPLSPAEYEARVLYVRDGAAREAADATFDVSDPAAPRRVWGDSC